MRITAYLPYIDQANQVTGVGRHMVNMTRHLAQVPGVELRTLTFHRHLADGRFPKGSLYAGLPATQLPLDMAWLHRLWVLLGQPKVDRWCGDAEWLYCPMEVYVPTRRVPVVVTVHDLYAFEPGMPWSDMPANYRLRRKWQMKFRPMLRDTRLFAAVSEYTRSRLVALLGVDPRKIMVVGNGVEEPFFAVSEKPAAQFARREGPYVLVVGGLTQRKGGSYVLAVARALAERHRELRVLVAGHSDADLDVQARSMMNVVRLGYVPDAQLPGLMRGAVALLCLSRYEGFGIPAAEAMAAGTPAIVSTAAALPEVVGDAGMVTDPEKPEQIGEMIVNLARDGALRQRYADLGRSRAVRFRWDACAERLVVALREHAAAH